MINQETMKWPLKANIRKTHTNLRTKMSKHSRESSEKILLVQLCFLQIPVEGVFSVIADIQGAAKRSQRNRSLIWYVVFDGHFYCPGSTNSWFFIHQVSAQQLIIHMPSGEARQFWWNGKLSCVSDNCPFHFQLSIHLLVLFLRFHLLC